MEVQAENRAKKSPTYILSGTCQPAGYTFQSAILLIINENYSTHVIFRILHITLIARDQMHMDVKNRGSKKINNNGLPLYKSNNYAQLPREGPRPFL